MITSEKRLAAALILGLALLAPAPRTVAAREAQGRIKICLNPVWRFVLGEPPGAPYAAAYDDSRWDVVSLPHSHEIFSAGLAGFEERGRRSGWYRRWFDVRAAWRGRNIFLEFQGAMQTTALWVNGRKVGDYAVSGYDSFHFDITPYVRPGRNLIAARIDNRVNPEIPPDGQRMDYILFGGLYRDVFLHVADPVHITFPWEAPKAGVRITLPELSAGRAVVLAETTVRNSDTRSRRCSLVTEVRDRSEHVVAAMQDDREIPGGAEHTFVQRSPPIANPRLWSPGDPYLYAVHTAVRDGSRELDRQRTKLGMRWVKFDREQGFFLNGTHLKLVGANRHQTWPFIGNAVPNSLHRRDAEQLKSMGIHWVRLSHYPHDPDFLDMLDELGMMALAEAPTWMNPGPGLWQSNMEASFRSMIRRDRNHPCIIVWNVCINHRLPHPALVRAALEEDPGRARGVTGPGRAPAVAQAEPDGTGGLPEIPTPMDFAHLRVSGEGALTIEHTGHTYPAARGQRSGSNREYQQARRHWEQTNAAYLKPGNSGLAVWCMYDYNTFQNTSEPGMVRHGVFDLFRLPKYSYWWHVSELTRTPMVFLVPIDETRAAVFSNCEQVRLLQDTGAGYREVGTRSPDTKFTGTVPPERPRVAPGQPAPPLPAPEVREIPYALRHPPFHFEVEAGAAALRAEGLVGGLVKAAHEWKKPGATTAIQLEADDRSIAADGADLNVVSVAVRDAAGAVAEESDAEILFAIDGGGRLIGENPARLRAGRAIILVQAGFVPGEVTVSATSPGLRPGKAKIRMQPAGVGVDMPAVLPATLPAARKVVAASSPEPEGYDRRRAAAAPVPEPLALPPKTDVRAGVWVESDPLLIPGLPSSEIPILIEGGEYRIYSSAWTRQPGKVVGGDVVYVRVKSSPQNGGGVSATLEIGNEKVSFEVRTREEGRGKKER